MKTSPECHACLIRQVQATLTRTLHDSAAIQNILSDLTREAASLDRILPPPVLTAKLQALLRLRTGITDPYHAEKVQFTRFAHHILPPLEKEAAASPDPFLSAVRLAVAGNVIDFGAKHNLTEADALAAIHSATEEPLLGDVEAFREEAAKAESILYLTDNAGETVLDRLLLAQLPEGRVTLAARGKPILNDATIDDAKAAGLDEFGPIVSNGSDVPGTWLDSCSPEFRDLFRHADLIISKGQGNYETLCSEAAPVFFLFRVKCPLVAEMAQQPLQANVCLRSACFTRRSSSSRYRECDECPSRI